ncbi:MAG: hypothetical protein Fur002_09020 [Anaerolineales bacterium]
MSEPNAIYQQGESDEKRAQYAFNISIATGVIFIGLILVVFILGGGAVSNLSVLMLAATATIAFYSAWLSKRGKSVLGALLVIGALTAVTIGRVFVQQGLSISTGVTNIILTSTIAFYALPPRWLGRVISFSFIATLITILIDQNAAPQIATGGGNSGAGAYIALALGVFYAVAIARQFPNFNLRTKLIIGFLALSVIPLVILGWRTYQTSQSLLQQQVETGLIENAANVSASYASFLTEQISTLQAEASLNDIIAFAESQAQAPRNQQDLKVHALDALNIFASKDKEFVISYSLLDAHGRNILDTVPANLNTIYANEDFFIEPFSSGQAYISNVQFPRKFSAPVLYISAPIYNRQNNVIGVLIATYNANYLQAILQTSVENRKSGSEYTFVIDGTYFVNLAHSAKPNLIHKSYLSLESGALENLQQNNVLPQGGADDLLAPQVEVVDAIRNMSLQAKFEAPSLENGNIAAKFAAARVPNANWIVVTAEPISAIDVLTQKQTKSTVVASAVISLFAALIALLASNFFTTPIVELTGVAQRLSDGDFTQRATVKSNDEIGILSQTFNAMSAQIQTLVGGLEARVEERTAALEQTNAQSEKRARDLQIIAEISRYISTEKNLEDLLQLITRTVSEQFGFYHVGIFLLNESKNFAVLRAANSPGGQRMLERQHKLEVGQVGIVGNVTASGAARIALDTGADAVYFNNPDLPETHSEMALPLQARGEIIGALDVQSTKPNAFSSSDISTLSLLADQIAIAIDNARLLEDAQRALQDAQALSREYVTEAWQTKGDTQIIGYHQTVTGGNIITPKVAEEIERELQDKPSLIEIPIELRGQTIGTLNIRANEEKKLSPAQISVAQAVTERLGLALENARLFEETSTRATRERLVTEITTKIRSTNDPQEMIKTAVSELQRALGASRVEIVPKKSAAALRDK